MNLTKNVEKKHHRNTCVFRNARLGDKTNKSKAEIVVKVWKAVGAGRRDCQLTRRGFLSEGYKPVSSEIRDFLRLCPQVNAFYCKIFFFKKLFVLMQLDLS